MQLIKPTTWEHVFRDWEKREGHNPDWIKCATEVKGWPDWKSWRGFTAQQIDAPARKWQIFRFTDPLAEIPEMLLGPFSSWQEGQARPNVASFAELLAQPDAYRKFSQNQKVLQTMSALPFTTQFIGLRRADRNKIACIEGHHRAVAITLAKLQNRKIGFGEVEITIALASVPKEETGLFDKILARGTTKK